MGADESVNVVDAINTLCHGLRRRQIEIHLDNHPRLIRITFSDQINVLNGTKLGKPLFESIRRDMGRQTGEENFLHGDERQS